MFQSGDMVAMKNGDTFSNGSRVVTVKSQTLHKVWLKETDTFIHEDSIELVLPVDKSNKPKGETKVENNKLIVTEPAFNKEAIKEGMFIVVKYQRDNFTVSTNGIVSNVFEKSISYVVIDKRIVATRSVSIDAVINGRAQIQVADSLQAEPQQTVHEYRDELNKLINGAKLFISPEEDFIYFTTGGKCRGRFFSHVRVDGVKYVPETTVTFGPKGEK